MRGPRFLESKWTTVSFDGKEEEEEEEKEEEGEKEKEQEDQQQGEETVNEDQQKKKKAWSLEDDDDDDEEEEAEGVKEEVQVSILCCEGCALRKITRGPKVPNYEIQGAQCKAYMK